MDSVEHTKELIQTFRENGWEELFDKVKKFCAKRDIDIPDMTSLRRSGRGRLKKNNPITLAYHYRIDIFTSTIDSLLQEMNRRLDKNAIELLRLSSALDPRDGYKSFNIGNICELIEKFYPDNFTSYEKSHVKYQLEMFELDIQRNAHFQNLSSVSELGQVLFKTEKATTYYIVDRLIRLLLTLPVSTATTDRAFSSMKIVKNRLRNKMEDDFLASSLLVYIEKEIVRTVDTDSLIDEFERMKNHRSQFTTSKK